MSAAVLLCAGQRYPGKQLVLVLDHSTAHHAMPDDALIASKKNMSDGGAQPKMRNGWYFDSNGVKCIQPMVTESGVAKGIKTCLIERGLWQAALDYAAAENEQRRLREPTSRRQPVRVKTYCGRCCCAEWRDVLCSWYFG